MKTPSQSEILSDLLDGRLSDAQRLEVERQLDQDPELVKLLDELSEIRAGIKRLPLLQPSQNLTAQVMDHIRPALQPAKAVAKSRDSQFNRVRNAVSIAAALAATVLITTLIVIQFERGQQVAFAPAEIAETKIDSPPVLSGAITEDDGPSSERGRPDFAALSGKSLELKKGDLALRSAKVDSAGAGSDFAINDQVLAVDPKNSGQKSEVESATRINADPSQHAMQLQAADTVPSEKSIAQVVAEPNAETAMPSPATPRDDSNLFESKSQLAENQPDRPQPDNAVEAEGPVFDHLLIVVTPPIESADLWMASVFQRADVNLEDGLGDAFKDRLDLRQLKNKEQNNRLADDIDSGALAKGSIDKNADAAQGDRSESGLGVDDSSNKDVAQSASDIVEPNAAPSSLEYSVAAEGFYVEATVPQLRAIIDQMDGASIRGFPRSATSAQQVQEPEQNGRYFDGPPAVARRLPRMRTLNETTENDNLRSNWAMQTEANRESRSRQIFRSLGIQEDSDRSLRFLIVIQPAQLGTAEAQPGPIEK